MNKLSIILNSVINENNKVMKIFNKSINQLMVFLFICTILFSCKKETIENTEALKVDNSINITGSVKELIKQKLTNNDFDNINWNNTFLKEVENSETKLLQIQFKNGNDINTRSFALVYLTKQDLFLKGQILKIKANSYDSLGQINGTYYEANLDRTNEQTFEVLRGFKIENANTSNMSTTNYPHVYISLASWFNLLDYFGAGGLYSGINLPSDGGGGGGGGGSTSTSSIIYSYNSLYLTNFLQLGPTERTWLNNNTSFAQQLFVGLVESRNIDAGCDDDVLYPQNYTPFEATCAAKITIAVAMANQLNAPITESHYNIFIKSNLPFPRNQANMDPMWPIYFSIQCAILKQENPNWSDGKIYWEAIRDVLHMGLDVVGMVPIIGEIADLANGVIYTIEGDGINATLSFAAMIPIAGWGATGVKFAKRSLIALNGSKCVLYLRKTVNGLIDFGDRGMLRRVLGLATGDARVAHHLIPWSLSSHPLVQKAAEAGFHLNHYLNGIPLGALQHNNGGHLVYNSTVANYLQNQIINFQGGINAISNMGAENILNILNNKIRTWIVNNPGVSINNLVL